MPVSKKRAQPNTPAVTAGTEQRRDSEACIPYLVLQKLTTNARANSAVESYWARRSHWEVRSLARALQRVAVHILTLAE
jgi:hypothetical protein